ncbi:MAG: MoaD/ThiS family protein [Proteobacteria bacterium]|nr:MoaD/ThiS family protein [Pseudomonadota bacterium]
MKNIKILFFGKLKDTWNTSCLSRTTQCDTIELLYTELLNSANEVPHKASIKVAINDEFTDWDAAICDGDTIAFLPPASGG